MPSVSEVNAAVQASIEAIAQGTVIFSEQNAERPSLPYVSMKMTVAPSAEHAIYEDMDGASDQQTKVLIHDATYSVHYHANNGRSAVELLTTMRMKLWSDSFRLAMNDSDVVFVDASAAQDTTWLNDNLYEGRASMDVFVRFAMTDTDSPNYAETVEASYDVDGHTGNITI